jgi:outer membrane protein OmpA-like peptidoglycan-associated protein
VSNTKSGIGVPLFKSSSDYDSGLGLYAALGYNYGNGLRMEAEFSHRKNDISSIAAAGAFSGLPSGSIAGSSTVKAVMVNAFYDFSQGALQPYIGAGIGYAHMKNTIAGATAAPLTLAYGSQELDLVYQGIAGIALKLDPSLLLDVSYRYMGNVESAMSGVLNGFPTVLKVQNNSHNIFAGLRWNFNGEDSGTQYKDCWDGSSVPMTSECPPQMLEEQAADSEPLTFTVYFAYDKFNLTDEASELIARAAAQAMANDINSVRVEGNTDTSGSSAYNEQLSQRRAEAVAAALVAHGVPGNRITVSALGETNLAKPTPDGVREPLNRRSEVVIRFAPAPTN